MKYDKDYQEAAKEENIKNIVQKQEQKNIKKSEKNTCIFLRGRVYSQLL